MRESECGALLAHRGAKRSGIGHVGRRTGNSGGAVTMRCRILLFLAFAAVATAQPYGSGALAGGGVAAAGIAAADGGRNAPRQGRDRAQGTTNPDAVWQKAGADEGLRQAFERAVYALEESGHGTYRGDNPAQRLTLEFNEREARLSHPDGSVSFHLTGYGYGDRLRTPAGATLTGTGNRVEYQRGDLTEWYVNGSQGLEQGFTLAHRPGTDRAGEPLVIALGVAGGLAPAQKADKDAVLFESGRGAVLRYAGLKAVDAGGRILASRLEERGREIRLIVEDESAEYPLAVDPLWTQQQELTASDGAAYDALGSSVSVCGNTAVIGAPGKTIGSNSHQGAAYVFVRSGGVWSKQQELTASDGAAGDGFGRSVSVSGDTAVIATINANTPQGAAYVFVESDGAWSQQAKLTASDGAVGDYFGWSVSVSGDTAVIGAFGKNDYQGAAYVFVGSNGVWSQQLKLTASDGAVGDYFGWSVSVSGDTAVIGADGKSIGGAAYVFVESGGAWSQQAKLTASDRAALDSFGYSVSVSGDTAVIGAAYKTITNTYQGAAYVFVRSSGVWGQQGQELAASDGAAWDDFGSTVSVGGDTAVIGAPSKNIGSNTEQGAAYVFVRSSGVWSQQQELTASDGARYDYFGSVSVSGNTAVIGAGNTTINSNVEQGAAYVFVGPMLGTNALLVGSAAGTSSVVLSTLGAWTATANASFLHISTGSASGTGNAVVVFTYDAFTGTGTRMGTLTIAGLTVTVTQAGTNYIGPGPLIALVSSGLYFPEGVAVDGSGNVYIADTLLHNAIKEWSVSTQQVTTLTYADRPAGVAVDGSGNVYIADNLGNAIEEWSAATQQVTTLVSSGLKRPAGVAVDGSGNVYIADAWNNAIEVWSASMQAVVTLVSSGLAIPNGAAVDGSGNVYIADTNNNAIKEWSAATQQVTTLVSSGLSDPSGVAVDGSGNVYIADTDNNAIKEWSASTQQVTTLVSSALEGPYGVAVDGSGNVYIADTSNNAIEEIPYAFVGPASLTEPGSAGTDSLLPVLPATANLTGIFAPTSDQSWLTIGTIANGVIGFSFTTNTSAARTAHITVLGQQITVNQNEVATLQSISIAPAGPSIAKGLTQQFTATGTYSDNSTQNVTASVTWTSATTTVATIASGGLATGAGVGTSNITAILNGVTSPADVLTVTAATLQSIAVTPAGPSVAEGLTQQFTATGQYSDNSTVNLTSQATWNSSAPAVATINSSGLATAKSVGQTNITAAMSGITSNALQLTVTAGSPAAISIESGSGQNALVGTAFANPLVVLVQDGGGDAVPNAPVTFTAPSSGAGATFANGLTAYTTSTNATGRATSTALTANAIAGSYSVTAAVTGLAGVSFSLTNLKAPVLSIGKSHVGNFIQGQNGATYAVTVGNGASAGPTGETVTVTENVPTGLTLVSMSGTGWTCPSNGNTCTRSDSLSPGSTYPITVTVNVASNAPSQVTNQVSVTGGGSANANANNVTTINPATLAITTTSLPSANEGAFYSLALSATGGTPPYSNWTVSSGSLPPPLTLNSASGVISGIPPSVVGSPFNFSVTVQDSAGVTSAAVPLQLVVNPPSWTQFAPTGGLPPARQAHSAVFDAATSQMIIYGGAGVPDFSDVWSLSTSSSQQWASVTTAGTAPPGRTGHSAVYDAANSRMVIFGGGLGSSSPCANDTWVLSNANGASGTPTWTQLNPTGTLPVPRIFHSAVYDPASNRMIVFGGNNCFTAGAQFYNDVWVLTNANGLGGTPSWSQLAPTGEPPSARENFAAVYDPGSNRMVIFGGNGPTNDVWVLSNANGLGGTPTWTQLSPSGTLIPARVAHTAVYDPAKNRMIVFGGQGVSGAPLNDIWVLTDANGVGTPGWWQVALPGTPPPARSEHSAVFDAGSSRMIVFGGEGTSGTPLNDTWVWQAGIYLAGDVSPATSDTAPNFGDGILNILDLVQELFCVNNIPGFCPAACSDRWDAMDLYPADTGSTRGGDGVLDVRDLVLELFRANNLDLNRPVRPSRGGACAGTANASLANPTAASRASGAVPRTTAEVEGVLVLGAPEKPANGEDRVPVYLEARHDLVRIAVTFALGDQQSQLRFVPVAGMRPSLAQDGQLGVVAAAWLEGVTVRAGERLLLGYVVEPTGASANLKVFGMSASGLNDGREVRLGVSSAAGVNR
jgi:hypothetical protein